LISLTSRPTISHGMTPCTCLSVIEKRHRLWLLINPSAEEADGLMPRSLSGRGEASMAPTRKTRRTTAPSTTHAKRKRVKPHTIKATLPPGMLAPSLTLPVTSPGFLIVGIGASAGGLEALEEFFRHMP